MPEENSAVPPASQTGTEGAKPTETVPSQATPPATPPEAISSDKKKDVKSASRIEQRFATYTAKLKDASAEIERLKAMQVDPEKMSDEDKELLATAKKMGFISAQDMLKASERTKTEAESEISVLLSEAEDSIPGFDRKEVLEYMDKSGLYNPVQAYWALQGQKAAIKKIPADAPKIEKPESKGSAGAPAPKPVSFEDGSLRESLTEKIKKMQQSQ